jgi:tRNA(Ile)-lysidine synthase
MKIPEAGTYRMSDGQRFSFSFSDVVEVSKSADCATIDKESVEFPLTIRTVEPGDRFIPYGMKGARLVSDYLTDHKLNLLEKRRQLVVTDACGRIVWLVGHRTDDRFKVTTNTCSILRIERRIH